MFALGAALLGHQGVLASPFEGLPGSCYLKMNTAPCCPQDALRPDELAWKMRINHLCNKGMWVRGWVGDGFIFFKPGCQFTKIMAAKNYYCKTRQIVLFYRCFQVALTNYHQRQKSAGKKGLEQTSAPGALMSKTRGRGDCGRF